MEHKSNKIQMKLSASWLVRLQHLKEYYEIVDEARPLSRFVPIHADLFTEMHF